MHFKKRIITHNNANIFSIISISSRFMIVSNKLNQFKYAFLQTFPFYYHFIRVERRRLEIGS